jgi:hypothetical protein
MRGRAGAALLLALSAAACQKGAPPAAEAPVIISELMYHPVLEDDPTEHHEFVELENRTDREIDLARWRLSGGIRFMFRAGMVLPPRGLLVVAKNRARLLADVPSYGLRPDGVTGDYDGELDNDGERIVLFDAAGDAVDEVAYGDKFPWPVAADALGASDDWLPPELLPLERHRFKGRSLERVGAGPGTSPASWVASPISGPTPGRAAAKGQAPLVAESLTLAPDRSSNSIVRPVDSVVVRARLSGPASAVAVEYFLDDVEREDEPRKLAPLEATAEGWEALLPPQAAGSIVRYRLLADRGRGPEPIAPREGDPHSHFGYFVTPNIIGSTPVYQLFLKKDHWTSLWDNIARGRIPGNGSGTNPFACAVNEEWNARVPAVLAVDGRVYDVLVRYEGSFQNRVNGALMDPMKWPATAVRPDRPSPLRALSWSIKFPRYRRLDGKRSFNLNKLNQSCHGFTTLLGNALFERAGIPAAQSQHVRLYVNGTYYHYMLRMEHLDDDFIKRFYGKGTPGDLFKSVGGRWDEGPYGYSDERPLEPYCGYSADERYRYNYDRATNEDYESGAAEVKELIEALAAARAEGLPAIRRFFEERFDMEALASYMAVINWMVAWDDQYHNHYLYERPDGRWMMIPTDMDNMMGGAAPSLFDASFFTGQYNVRSNRNDYWNHLKDAYLRAFREEFLAKVVELDRTVLHPDAVSALIDEVTAPYQADEAMLSPAGVACGTHTSAIQRLKNFAYGRSARIAAGLFD